MSCSADTSLRRRVPPQQQEQNFPIREPQEHCKDRPEPRCQHPHQRRRGCVTLLLFGLELGPRLCVCVNVKLTDVRPTHRREGPSRQFSPRHRTVTLQLQSTRQGCPVLAGREVRLYSVRVEAIAMHTNDPPLLQIHCRDAWLTCTGLADTLASRQGVCPLRPAPRLHRALR